MIVVGIVAHTQEFFDKRLNFHQMALLQQQHQAQQRHLAAAAPTAAQPEPHFAAADHSNSNYSIAVEHDYLLASFDDGFDVGRQVALAAADFVGQD